MAHANLAVIFCCLRTWITFRTFVLETCWWHGVPAQLPPLCCKCCYINSEENSGNWCGCGFGFFKWCSYQKRGNVDESDWANSTLSTGNTRGATKSVEGMNKLNILDGVDLTPSAGKSMGRDRIAFYQTHHRIKLPSINNKMLLTFFFTVRYINNCCCTRMIL